MVKDMIVILNLNPKNLIFLESWSYNMVSKLGLTLFYNLFPVYFYKFMKDFY